MHNEFTAIIERDEEWFIAYCPEIPGANGHGRTQTKRAPVLPAQSP
jgi:predicted RNase H-like HicB family nuclease